MLRKGICVILSLLVLVGGVPVAQVASADTSLNLYDITSTNYGVIDKDVVATRFAEGEGYDIVYPPNPADYEKSEFSFATPCVIIREAYEGDTYKYSLVSSHRVVKTYLATQKPEIELMSDVDANGNVPTNSVYRVYNPQTLKYDVYNANTDTYYEYGLDRIFSLSAYSYTYWSNCYEVTKDSLYGLLDSTGKMIYEPVYKSMTYYKNCAIGASSTESGKIAILSNNGKTSGTKLYSGVGQIDSTIFAVRDYNESGELLYAALSPTALKVLTDFKYKEIKPAMYKQVPYFVGLVNFKDSNNSTRSCYDVVYKDNVLDSRTIAGGYSNYWENKDYFTNYKYQYGSLSFSASSEDYNTNVYKVVNLEGKTLYTSQTNDTFYKYLMGYMNQTAITYEYVGSGNTRVYKIYNSAGQVIATSGYRPEVCGDYLLAQNNDQAWIYDYVKGEIVHTGGTYVNTDVFCGSYQPLANKMVILQNDQGKRGLFHVQSGKFSDYIFTADELENVSVDVTLTNGTRGAWSVLSAGGDTTAYVTDSFVLIPTTNLMVSGDCLFEDRNQSSFETDRLWDYDGKVVKEFVRRTPQSGYSEPDEEHPSLEGFGTVDATTQLQGFVTANGKEVLGNHYTHVGSMRNGFTFVAQGFSGLAYQAALVDTNGNALIFGTYDQGFGQSYRSFRYDKGGFLAFNKEENNKQCVYLYDFTACLGLDSQIELPDEDILFGEYNSYLNSNFYNTAADTITQAIATSVAKKTTASSTAIALAKSGLDDGLEFLAKELLSWLPGNDINQDKLCQEIALQYLEELDTETVENYINEITELNDFAGKVDKYYTQIKDLSGEKNKLAFCNLWVSDEFSKSDVYQLVETAEKNKVKLGDVVDKTGKVISVAEYVMTYMMICSIESQMIDRLMALTPEHSPLYQGLAYIRLQQKDKYMAIFTAEMFTDEMIGAFCDVLEEGIVKLVTDAKPSLVLFVVKTGMKLLAKTIDSPKMEDIDKAVVAFANIITLKQAVAEHRAFIRSNYEKQMNVSLNVMKYDYEMLMRTYFKALLVGLDYAEVLENQEGKVLISQLKEEYTPKLRYYSYLQTCLINATAMWEYTVEGNKAVLNKLKAEFPKGAGRIPLYDLMFGNEYDLNEVYNREAPKTQYCIDIPQTVDGYAVSGIGTGAVSGQSKINGVYLPDSVQSVESNAFENCSELKTVLVSEGTNASENAYGTAQPVSREKDVVRVKVVIPPTQKELGMQDALDTNGMVLEVTYADGSAKTVTQGMVAFIVNRQNGENDVVVKYNGVETSYPVTVNQTQCQYAVSCVDNFGNVLREPVSETALSGTTVTVDAPAIEGYTPKESQITHTIGFENNLVFVYTANPKANVEEAEVLLVDEVEFTGDYLTPEVVVNINGKRLQQDVDYTVKYDCNRMPGKGYAYIFGCGDYAGILEVTFVIAGAVQYGDLNGDIKVNASDALWVLQAAVGKRTLDEQQKVLGDVNGDGKQNAGDALLILRYAVKKITKFPVEE